MTTPNTVPATKSGESMSDRGSTIDMFLQKALEQISKLAGRRDDELKKECEATILSLGRLLPPIPPDAAAPSPPLKELLPPAKLDALANKIIPTLRLAIKTGTPTIVGVALDTIHKLLVYNCIRSDCVDTSSSNARLTDTVIELISACFEIGEKDEAVQLQIIKALLTAITSPVCGVHEESLMTAVRTSYNIYLISQSQINRRTAKATLTQMLHLIFQRMEAHGAARLQNSATRASTSDTTSAARSSHGSSSPPPSLSSSSSQPIVPQGLSGSEDSSSAEIDPALREFGDGDGIPPPAQADDEDETPVPTEGDPIAAEAIAEIAEEAEADLLVEDEIEGGSSQSAELTQPEPTFQPEPTLQPESTLQPEASIPANPSEGVGSALPIEEAASSMGPPPPPHRNAPPNSEEHSESLIYTDCFLIFRALCKLSVTDVPKGFADPSSIDMRSKVLSLELLLTVLEGAGPVLRSHRKFIAQAIKKYLCISLLTNGVSPVPKIFQLSLSIFWALLSSFKENLKNEIGIFFKKIFLPLLESPHSTVQQKWMVLQILLKICRIPQTLLELFVNYDCSSDPNNLVFEPMVRDIAAIAKGTPTIDTWTTPAQDAKMRTMGLECLVAIARSLVSWSNELMSDAHDENLNASLVAAGGAAAAAANAAADASKKAPSSSAPRSDDAVRSADDKSEDEIEQSCAAPSTSTSAVDPQKKADPIEEQLRHNQQLRRGFELFNRRPKRGLEFLIKIGHITSEPPSIARLLRSERSLEKATVGDFLGGHDAFNVSVMYAYVDLFSFAGMTLDMAIRNFLAEFRLPKEAKQIDRIMEKFASRFYEDNCPTPHFANATSAFVLAFAVIMLATDLHSPAIVKKITKPEWRNMLRGQNDNQDFPAEFLDPMYERVGSAPLKVNRDDKTAPKVAPSGGFITPKNRLQLFHQETLEMIQKSRAELKENLSADADPLLGYFVSPELHHVRPIFEVCWGAMLAAFGQLLESSDDQNAINLCLEGFRLAIRIAGIFYLETPRASFINALRKFSLLDSTMVRRHRLQRKNVDSIVTLLELALTDGNYFQSSWGIVLECISQLDRLSTLTTFGIHSDTELQSPEPLAAGDKAKQQRLRKPASADPRQAAGAGRPAPSRSPGIPPSSADLTDDAPSSLASYFGGDNPGERARREAELAASIEAHNASIVTHSIDVSMIDKIFSHTVKLNGDAIVEFVQALCEVSVREIANPKGPRLFSLRKIVEVASFNMDRIRLIWSRVWSHLSAHCEKVGCDDRLTVAMYAIDSLRQLAMKFLEKDELANFSFQHLFLKPFDYISQNTNSSVIRELIIRCLTQMVSARAR
ncbi:MAG: Sec7 domain-containing protein, partial [archaeon]|nr:Sec7 domain-containing protein [archaeon]